MDEASRRNFVTLADRVVEESSRNIKNEESITSLQARVTVLEQEINSLRQQVTVFLAVARGTGPTSR